MTANNFERMKIVLVMVDPFDYDEFLRICETEKIAPLTLNEYAMKTGFVMMAQGKYSEIPIEEAYMIIVSDANGQQPVGCSSCGDKKDKPLPSLAAQAGNLVAAVGRHAMSGFTEADKDIIEKRMLECNSCDNMRTDGRCSKCGCYMQIKAKWESVKCPINKW